MTPGRESGRRQGAGVSADEPLERRVPVTSAARYLGCSPRHVRDLIESGDLRAADVRVSGARRATWAIEIASVRAFIARRARNIGDVGTTDGAPLSSRASA